MTPEDAFSAFERAGWSTGRAEPYHHGLGRITTRVIEPLLDAAAVGEGSAVLDVASGPGYAAAAAASRGSDAVGVDFAPEMVALARRLHPDASFVEGEATALAFDDAAFDAAIANFLMPHVTDLPACVAELARVVRPGGRVALTTWDPAPPTFLNAMLAAIASAGAVQPPSLPPGPPFFQYAADDEFAALLTGAGLSDPVVEAVPFTVPVDDPDRLYDEIIGGSVRTSAMIQGQTPEVQAAIRAGYAERLASWGSEVPVSVKLGSARR